MPLANDYRPTSIKDFIGQKHLVGEKKPIYNFIKNQFIPNMILYGPPGTGKTTLAKILANELKKEYKEIKGIHTSSEEIKEIINQAKYKKNTILFIDEIQYLTKKVQQLILDSIEIGDITLIAATADNPYFTIYKAIISRCVLFEFHTINSDDIQLHLHKVLNNLCEDKKVSISEISEVNETLSYIATISSGDVRKALNNLELSFYMGLSTDKVDLLLDNAKEVCKVMINHDKDGDSHYDLLSAFHKSMRGSDVNASIYYLARLIVSEGNLLDICRRILCVASEDIGLANPQAIVIAKSCVDSALQLGLPEARLPLAEAVMFLCLQPKSNSVYLTIDGAIQDIKNGNIKEMPNYLKDSHYEEAKELGELYKYPHNYPNHWVAQDYLPSDIKDKKYYNPQNNKFENAYASYWDKILNKSSK